MREGRDRSIINRSTSPNIPAPITGALMSPECSQDHTKIGFQANMDPEQNDEEFRSKVRHSMVDYNTMPALRSSIMDDHAGQATTLQSDTKIKVDRSGQIDKGQVKHTSNNFFFGSNTLDASGERPTMSQFKRSKTKFNASLGSGTESDAKVSLNTPDKSKVCDKSGSSKKHKSLQDENIFSKNQSTLHNVIAQLKNVTKFSSDLKVLQGYLDDQQEQDPTPNLVEGIFFLDRSSFFDTCQRRQPNQQQDQRIIVYDRRSLFLFDQQTRFRKFIVRATHSNTFETVIVLAIFLNSLVLALTDYNDRDNETQFNKTLERISTVFSYIFTVEFVLKVIAMGFIMHKKSYMRDPWNGLDFLVVISGLVEIFAGDKGSKSVRALRVLRVLRPLKSINAFPKMRRIISALLSSLPALGNAVAFMMFIFLLFGILGVQQFGSSMYYRCRFSEKPNEDGTWPFDETIPFLCSKESMGNFHCPADRYCFGPQDGQLSKEIDDIINDELIDYGITVFDNLGIGFITVFQMITLEGWTKVMYNMMDSNITWMAIIFCILLIVIGSFFLLNVILAVLAEALNQVDSIEQKQREKQDREIYMSLKRRELQDEKKLKADPNAKIVRLLTTSSQIRKKVSEPVTPKKQNCPENQDSERTPLQFALDTRRSNQSPLAGETGSEVQRNQQALQPIQEIGELSQESNEKLEQLSHKKSQPAILSEFLDQAPTLKDSQRSQSGVKMPDRSRKNWLYRTCYKICTHISFNILIILLIILNTIVLAMDSYPVDKDRQKVADTMNDIFTWCFFAEMIIKLLGLGFKGYARDANNIFDACLVIISLVDYIILQIPSLSMGSSGGALSAFRSIRLLRVFKLARSWTVFKELLQQIALTVKEVSYFLVLLIICMFIFALLGMELYGYKVKFAEDGDIMVDPTEPSNSPRPNFDTFYMAFTSIFIVFIGEDWHTLMHSHYRAQGISALFFFPTLYISLNLILLNLFLAILLQNFDINSKTDDDLDDYQVKAMEKVKRQVTKVFKAVCCKKAGAQVTPSDFTVKLSDESSEDNEVVEVDKNLLKVKPHLSQSIDGSSLKESVFSEQSGDDKDQVSQDDPNMNAPAKEPIARIQRNLSSASAVGGRSIELDSAVAETPKESDLPSPSKRVKPNIVQRIELDNMSLQEGRFAQQVTQKTQIMAMKQPQLNTSNDGDQNNEAKSTKLKRSALQQTLEFSIKKRRKQFDIGQEIVLFKRKKSLLKPQRTNLSIAALKKVDFLEDVSQGKKKNIEVTGSSCCIFSQTNMIRRMCQKIVEFEYYDTIVLGLIFISTILLTLDNPLNDQNGTLSKVLEILDIALTIAFTLECIINIILLGFLFNGPKSYLKDSWNILDFLIVIFSLINIAAAGVDLGIIKLFRMLRVLRPLRVLKRNLGLKIQVISLLNSIPGIMNLLAITMLLLMLFGIQGVNFFAGKMNYCNMDNIPEKVQAKVITKWDCFDYGGEWLQFAANFDNVFRAMMTMFTMMTTEGWASVMWQLIDTTEIHQMPQTNNEPLYIIFCSLFLIFGSLFILNLFVGVVINTFNQEKDRVSNNNMLTELQLEYLEVLKNCYQTQPKRRYELTGNKVRDFCRTVAQANSFGNFILACIILNTICLSITWFGEPEELTNIMEWVNIGFTVVYTVEMIIKLVAYKSNYYQDGWNNFDFLIVVFAWVGLISQFVFSINVGALTTVVRAFRILRVLKLIKKAKSLQKVLNTFLLAITELANVGALLFLFLFLFAILGVFLFSEVRLQENLNSHANFQNFGVALLTLFRITTGEGWHEIMYDCARQPGILFQCMQSQTYEERMLNGINGCGSLIAYPFFISFTLIVSLIFLNLFIAIILEGQLQATQQQEARISDSSRDLFVKAWTKYDPDATGFIRVDDLPKLIFDLTEDEYHMRKRTKRKKGTVMFNFTCYPEVKILMKINKAIPLSKMEAYLRANKRLQDQIEWEFRKFIGALAIPLYNKLSNYNFHDTLNAFAKMVFSEHHRRSYQERVERIEIAIKANHVDSLPFYDRIKRESPDYWKLDIMKQERVLEADDSNFQSVIDRMEDKGKDGTMILRLNNVRRLRVKAGQKIKNLMDLNYMGKSVLDSSQLIGAQRIKRFIYEWRERKAKKQKLPERQNQTNQEGQVDENHQSQVTYHSIGNLNSLKKQSVGAGFQSIETIGQLGSQDFKKDPSTVTETKTLRRGKDQFRVQVKNILQTNRINSLGSDEKGPFDSEQAELQIDPNDNDKIEQFDLSDLSDAQSSHVRSRNHLHASLHQSQSAKQGQAAHVNNENELDPVRFQTRRINTKLIDEQHQASQEIELSDREGQQKKPSKQASSQANGMNQPVLLSENQNDSDGGIPVQTELSSVDEQTSKNDKYQKQNDSNNEKIKSGGALVLDSKGSEAVQQDSPEHLRYSLNLPKQQRMESQVKPLSKSLQLGNKLKLNLKPKLDQMTTEIKVIQREGQIVTQRSFRNQQNGIVEKPRSIKVAFQSSFYKPEIEQRSPNPNFSNRSQKRE